MPHLRANSIIALVSYPLSAINLAFIPNVESFLVTEQYPSLAELNKKMTMMVDYIVEFGGAGNPDGRGVIDLQDSELTLVILWLMQLYVLQFLPC